MHTTTKSCIPHTLDLNHCLSGSVTSSSQYIKANASSPLLPLSYRDNTLSTHFVLFNIWSHSIYTISHWFTLKTPVPAPQPPISPSPSAFTVLHLWSLSEHQTVHCGDGCGHLTTGWAVYSCVSTSCGTKTWHMNVFNSSPLSLSDWFTMVAAMCQWICYAAGSRVIVGPQLVLLVPFKLCMRQWRRDRRRKKQREKKQPL